MQDTIRSADIDHNQKKLRMQEMGVCTPQNTTNRSCGVASNHPTARCYGEGKQPGIVGVRDGWLKGCWSPLPWLNYAVSIFIYFFTFIVVIISVAELWGKEDRAYLGWRAARLSTLRRTEGLSSSSSFRRWLQRSVMRFVVG